MVLTKEPPKGGYCQWRLLRASVECGIEENMIKEGEKGSKWLVVPHSVSPVTKMWCPGSISIMLPIFSTVLTTEVGEKV